MHFHLPKPLHGWREFAGEVGIIVLGVLIALGAQQLVDDWQWHESVSQMRNAMRAELAIDLKRVQVNLAQDPCVQARLEAILRWTASKPANARIANAGRPYLANYHTSTWDIAKTNPVVSHFSLKEQLTYASAYDAIANEQRYLFDEQGSWTDLAATLASADQPESRNQIERKVASARLHLANREVNAPLLLERLNDLGIKADPRGLPGPVDVRQLCGPLSG